LQRSIAILTIDVDVTARSKELFRDGLSPFSGREVERRAPFIVLKIDVTARSKELLRSDPLPKLEHTIGRGV
jgi:hypothetical protein